MATREPHSPAGPKRSPGAAESDVPLTIPTQSEASADSPAEVGCATILYHPDLRRVGERALLHALGRGAGVELSRIEPEFFAPRGDACPRSLEDPYLSARRPVRIESRWPSGLDVIPAPGAKLTVDGEPTDDRVTLPMSRVRAGVTLTLFKRVVLLLHATARQREPLPPLGLVGDSDAAHALRRAILNVADLDVPVLIRGESGVGKELVARAIHATSARASAACVAINMSAVPAALAESQLFGHARGAFSGASERRIGFFEQAAGGTLFLDEIGDTPQPVQAVLLRALDSGEIQPIGRSPRRVDVRVIAATEIDLDGAGKEGAFREALLHRLAGFEISVPPLRARRDDIARLIVHFLRTELARTGELHRLEPPPPGNPLWFPPRLMERMVAHDWKGGNVRALANAIRQLVVSSRGAGQLDPRALDVRLGAESSSGAPRARTRPAAPEPVSRGIDAPGGAPPTIPGGARHDPLAIEDDELVALMVAHAFQISRVADALGIPKSTAHGLVDKCPLLRKAKDIPRDELVQCLDAHGGDLRAVSRALMVAMRPLKMRLRQLGLL